MAAGPPDEISMVLIVPVLVVKMCPTLTYRHYTTEIIIKVHTESSKWWELIYVQCNR